MTRHPISRDGVRAYLARSSIYRIVLLFVLVIVALAMVNALIVSLLNPAEPRLEPSHMVLESVIALLGGDVSEQFRVLHYSRLSVAVLTLFSVLLPALLLGAVVYKVLIPRRRLTIFRRQANLVLEGPRLETCFYIATDLDVFDLDIKAYAKLYKPALDNGEPNPYPLKTVPLQTADRQIPQPFSFIPTRVNVPVAVLTPQDGGNPAVGNSGGMLGILVRDQHIEAIHVDGLVIRPGGNEFCELLVVVEGKIPTAQSTLLECESYDLLKSVKIGHTPTFKARFESERARYIVSNWEEFEPR